MIPILKVDHNTGNTLTIQNFFESLNTSYLLGDQVSGTTILGAINGTLFTTTNPYVVIGGFGSDTAELRSVSSSTATTVVVSSVTSFAHAQGEPIQNVRYNQVVIESATSQGGSYSVLATVNIDWTNSSTIYQHGAGTATTWYRVRFLNGGATVYSDYSDEAASSSFGVTTAGYLIERARSQMGDTTGLTDSFFVGALNDARNLANTNFGYGRMNEWRQNFEFPIQMLAGRNFVTLPTNIDLNIGAKGTGEVKHTTATYQDIVTATDGATVTFDVSDGNLQTVTLGGNRTLAISNAKVGQVFMLRLVQDGTGSRVPVFFSTIKWAGGTAPTLTTTAGKTDIVGFIVTSSGNYEGFVVGQNI